MHQRPCRLSELEFTIKRCRNNLDTYISQGFFAKPCRRALHLAWLTHGYIDADTYQVRALAGFTPEQIAAQIINVWRNEARAPLPTAIISSGRGIYMKWAWSSRLPRAAAGRAIAVNKALVLAFHDFGADCAAVDVSRILRVVGTVNSKSGEVVWILWLNEVNGTPVTYDFNAFCDEVLPFTSDDVRGFRKAANARHADDRILSEPIHEV